MAQAVRVRVSLRAPNIKIGLLALSVLQADFFVSVEISTDAKRGVFGAALADTMPR